MRRRDLISLLGGAAIAWPLAVPAQEPKKVYRIAGVIPSPSAYFLDEKTNPRSWRPFFEELRWLGFVEGQNLTVERHSGDGQADRYADLARRVVASAPDVIFCNSDRLAAHALAEEALERLPDDFDVVVERAVSRPDRLGAVRDGIDGGRCYDGGTRPFPASPPGLHGAQRIGLAAEGALVVSRATSRRFPGDPRLVAQDVAAFNPVSVSLPRLGAGP